MEDIFINKIKIREVGNLSDFDIPKEVTNKKHIILTGKNGSGKTRLLNAIKEYLEKTISIKYKTNSNRYNYLRSQIDQITSVWFNAQYLLPTDNIDTQNTKYFSYKNEIKDLEPYFAKIHQIGLFIEYNNIDAIIHEFNTGNFLVAYFGAKRSEVLNEPKGITKVDFKPYYTIEEKIGKEFIQYMVNLKADKSFANEEKDLEEAQKIDDWFKQFESKLLELIDVLDTKLVFDRKTYNFIIDEPNKEPYNLNQLSDGYAAILTIVTELIMRMEGHNTKNYDLKGIVLIDEIETHLHIDLQKKVLPFLISFFPKIQFIVTTHSPFVLTSVADAVVYDLEKNIELEDMSGYSYGAVVETYFDADKYSEFLKQKVATYEQLMEKSELTEDEQDDLEVLEKYFLEIPKIFSSGLKIKLNQIKLNKSLKKANR